MSCLPVRGEYPRALVSGLSYVQCGQTWYTVKDPNIAHLSLLTPVGYNKKETKLKKVHSQIK